MTDIVSKKIVIWDTSAICNLASRSDCEDLIVQMKIAHTHWIPAYVFTEIAATPVGETRNRLLSVCRKLKGSSGRVLIDHGFLVGAAIRLFSDPEMGEFDWKELLVHQPDYEQAIDSGVFNDDLAKKQKVQNQNNLMQAEDYFAQVKTQFDSLFQSGLDHPKTLDEIIAMAFSTGLVLRNIQYYFKCILGISVDLQYAERFAKTFPPIVAMICAFLIGHYDRNKPEPTKKPAGATDLLAAMYLPACHKFVSNDQDQQIVFRNVAKYCSLQAEVVWFSRDFTSLLSPN
jgi:hypothetical protein